MKQLTVLLLLASIFVGCAPKMGKDIFIEQAGDVRLESSGNDILLGFLALIGPTGKKDGIKIATDVKITNRWHSDIILHSLKYSLGDNNSSVAQGEIKADATKKVIFISGKEKIIPLEFRIELSKESLTYLYGAVQSKRKIFLKGEVAVEVWGVQKHYNFKEDVTARLSKEINKKFELFSGLRVTK